ncbi:MAG: alkaline phosphatase D family protein [Actinomycetota bacterium]|nr:alkaline phosphatase D family protein [Actinomycetota bacterium]
MNLDRRRFLTLAGGAAAGVAAIGRLREPATATAADLDPGPFALGVASGDPAHDSVVLWTRLAPAPLDGGGMPPEPVAVRWELARDEGFARVIQHGEVTADSAEAHAVHVEVSDLAPDSWYWYRFSALGADSRIGRTRTLPTPGAKAERLRLAVASCQAWVGGPYPAYRDMAEQDVDLVLHLGDYIYETSGGSLEEFRRLHALYRTSPDLRQAHARFPFVVTWDDHEVINNYAAGIGSSPDGRPFLERRANAYQAYYEHLPLRRTAMPSGPDTLLYRRFAWGRLAEFSVLDGRQYRSDQPCGDPFIGPTCGEEDDPSRTMLGPAQERWVLDGLAASRARWNVLAQQTIMAPYDYDVGPDEYRALDAWDGYPAARERILDAFATGGVTNPVVLAGDWHSSWVNDLDRDGRTVASEFAGTSISSGCGWDASVRLGLPANPQVRFYEGAYRGYLLCEISPERWRTDLRIVTAPRDPASPAHLLAAFEVADGRPGPVRLDAGTGVASRMTSAADGAALTSVQLEVRDSAGRLLIARLSDAHGEASVFAAPGTYELTANGVGFELARRTVTVTEDRVSRVDFALTPVTLRAATGRILPGPLAEGTAQDIVLENGEVAVAIAAVTEDSQLAPATRGKPRDLAARGFADQLDWMNLPYASLAQPRGGNAWQQRTVRNTAVTVPEPGVVRAVGACTQAPQLEVVTTYRLEAGARWIAAHSAFANGGAAPLTVWVGDVIDHDGAGQRSGVAGHATITSGPSDYTPAGRWIAMTGTDGQLYGLVYDEGGWIAYAAGIWVMTQRQVTIAAGETFTLGRRIIATAAAREGSPWAPLEQL